MSIKAKISASIALLVIVAVTAIGLVTVNVVSTQLTQQVDDQIQKYIQQSFEDRKVSPDLISKEDGRDYSVFALMLFEGDELVGLVESGYVDQSDPAPDIRSAPEPGEFFTAPSVGHGPGYRAYAMYDPASNQTLVVAESLSNVENAVKALTATIVITGSLVALATIMIAWMVMQRGFRSVDRMVQDAETVAGGNLDHRITPQPPDSEMGRLSAALNLMVNRLAYSITEGEAQRQRLKQFVADAGHELRTPLTAIGGYVQLYQNGAAREGEKLDRAMDRIGAENARLAHLVDDLMVLARLDRNVQAEQTPVDLSQLAADAVDDATAADSGHVFELGGPPADPDADPRIVVLANEGQIRQILVNLITNARVHTPEGSTVSVTVRDEGETAVIAVSDNGPGIPEKHRRRIFDRFYRADPSRSRNTGGTGLGLSIVSAIVAGHHGTIDLDSRENEGTTITVRLPKVWMGAPEA
ncbi:sensor histidine kinase [Salininema proteolyticum]|uniref:histidine kinase n=1 Tax=Salininema proteolyticum TaxID=1607685 RepID=A0ABV8U4Y4_9ACTN